MQLCMRKKREATDNKSWLTHTFRNAANIWFCVSFIVLWDEIKRNSAHSWMLDIKHCSQSCKICWFHAMVLIAGDIFLFRLVSSLINYKNALVGVGWVKLYGRSFEHENLDNLSQFRIVKSCVNYWKLNCSFRKKRIWFDN